MTFDLAVTLGAAASALGVTAWMIVLERRGPAPGRPRLVPTTPVLFVSILVLVLALAHLVTILTGSPHHGRFG